MRVLVDTHVLIWALGDHHRLSKRARRVLTTEAEEVFVSDASVWEMSIKLGLGKLELPVSLDAFLVYAQADLGQAQVLPIRRKHFFEVQHLPWHHRDPFYRLLVAQASTENLSILTADDRISRHPVHRIW